MVSLSKTRYHQLRAGLPRKINPDMNEKIVDWDDKNKHKQTNNMT